MKITHLQTAYVGVLKLTVDWTSPSDNWSKNLWLHANEF